MCHIISLLEGMFANAVETILHYHHLDPGHALTLEQQLKFSENYD